MVWVNTCGIIICMAASTGSREITVIALMAIVASDS